MCSQILYLKYLPFPQSPYVDKRYLCRLHTGMYEYLRELVDYHLYIRKKKCPNIDP